MTPRPRSPVSLRSILDTDLYKLAIQQAVLHHYPNVQAVYRFSNRYTNTRFSYRCYEDFRTMVSTFSQLILTDSEREWLGSTCSWFSDRYLDYLSYFRFKPDQVSIIFTPNDNDPSLGHIEIEIRGPWVECVLWEVPLMALLNEVYYQIDDDDWDNDNQREAAVRKGRDLFKADCSLIEFGTRRRRSFKTQELVVQGLVAASQTNESPGAGLVGTSNAYLASKYHLAPVCTVAHEWFMAVGALEGYENVNTTALRLWQEVYENSSGLLVALTDTFTSEAFYAETARNPEYARRWTGFQQDSGDPLCFAPQARKIYKKLGIDHRKKTLMYSDSLNTEKSVKIQQQCKELGFDKVLFAIGTYLTNDFRTKSSGYIEISPASVITIKLKSVNGIPCVKLSDDPSKVSGEEDAVAKVEQSLSLE